MLRPERHQRKCPGNALEKGGTGSITEQLLNARADVTLGGGAKTFAETATAGEWQGKTLHEQAIALGYQIVTDASSLAAVSEANQGKPLLGLFADGNSEEESMEHTGTQLRIAAYGPHAANVVGLTDQTDLFYTMKAALGLK